jgi:superkiller protein 3
LLNQRAWIEYDRQRYREALGTFARTLTGVAEEESALVAMVACYRRIKQFDDAGEALEAALRRLPGSTRLLNQRAWIEYDQQRYREALEAFARTLTQDADDESALVAMVACYRRIKQFDDAVEAAEAALRRLPGSTRLLNQRAWIEYDQQRYREALEAFARTLAQDADDESALERTVACHRQLKQFDKAVEAAEEALRRLPRSTRLLNQRAWIECDQKRHREALEAFARTLAQDADDEDALVWTVACYLQLKQFDKAVEAAEAALRRLPRSTPLLNERARIEFDQKRYREALEAFARTLAQDTDDESALEWTVVCYRQLKQFDKAVEVVETALQRLPRSTRLLNQQAWIEYDQKRYREALEALARTLAQDAGDESAHGWTVACYRQLKQFDKADEAVEVALRRLPGSTRLLNERAWIEYGRAQFSESIDAFSQTLLVDPKDEEALVGIIQCHRSLGAYQAALERVQTALRFDTLPLSVSLLCERAAIYFDQQLYDQALLSLTSAREVAPGDNTAIGAMAACHRKLKNFAAANVIVTSGLALDPWSTTLLIEHAQLALDQGQWDLARRRFEYILGLIPRQASAAAGRLACLRRLCSDEELSGRAEEALRDFPNSASVSNECGLILAKVGKLESAVDCFDRALHLDGSRRAPAYHTTVVLLRLQQPLDAIRRLETLRTRYPRDAQATYEFGMLLLVTKDLLRARAEFDDLLRGDSSNVFGKAGLAAFYSESGRHEEAAAVFADLARERREFAVHHAKVLIRMGSAHDLARAQELIDAVIGCDPVNTVALGCLGVVNYRHGRWLEGESALRRAVKLDPVGGPWRDLGALCAKQARYEEALRCIQRAIELNPYDTRAYIELAGIHLTHDQRREAVAMLRRALGVHTANPEAIQALAQGLIDTGDPHAAEHELREGMKRVEPSQCYELHVLLAATLRELAAKGRDEQLLREALAHTTQGIRMRSTATGAFFERGMSEHALGDPRSASRSFSEVLRIDPDHAAAQRNLQRLQPLLNQKRLEYFAARTGWAFSAFFVTMLVVTWTLYFRPLSAADTRQRATETSASAASMGSVPEGTSKVARSGTSTVPANSIGTRTAETGRINETAPRLSETMLLTFTPLFCGLIIVGLLMPVLTKLKLPGVEAELQQAKATIGKGPTGQALLAVVDLEPELVGTKPRPIGSGPTGH